MMTEGELFNKICQRVDATDDQHEIVQRWFDHSICSQVANPFAWVPGTEEISRQLNRILYSLVW